VFLKIGGYAHLGKKVKNNMSRDITKRMRELRINTNALNKNI